MSDRRVKGNTRVLAALAVVGLVVLAVVGLVVALGGFPKSAEQREQVARDQITGLSMAATATSVSLVAGGAIADFGIEEGVRLVRVRVVDELGLELEMTSAHDIVFAEPPTVCLVGPFAAPDDAGLESPCWGEPDLGEVVVSGLGRDAAGRPLLRRDAPIMLNVALLRGDERCDYPPGTWQLRVRGDLLVEGAPVDVRLTLDVLVDVPIPSHGPLVLLPRPESRYCGLATVVFQEQGEPDV